MARQLISTRQLIFIRTVVSLQVVELHSPNIYYKLRFNMFEAFVACIAKENI